MRAINFTLLLISILIPLYGCAGGATVSSKTDSVTPDLVSKPEPIFFSDEECAAIKFALTRGGGAYFALEASLEGFDTTNLIEKTFQKKFAELFWKDSKAMVWTLRVSAQTAIPDGRIVVPIFVWGENFNVGEDPIQIPARNSHRLITPYLILPADESIELRLGLRYTDKPEVNVAERLTEIIKLGVLVSGAIPGTHSVAAQLTSGVANRIDIGLSNFASNSQQPSFQAFDLTAAKLDDKITCATRQIGARYKISNKLLPSQTATIEVRTVFKLSKFTAARKGGYPDYEGNSLKSIERATLLVAEAVQRDGQLTLVANRHYAVEYLSKEDSLRTAWQTFQKAQDANTLKAMCGVILPAARDRLKLIRSDYLALIAYLYRYELNSSHLQAEVQRCLGDEDYRFLSQLNFSSNSLEVADAGPAVGKLAEALAKYGKTGVDESAFAAWTQLSGEIQTLISNEQVTFYEFASNSGGSQILKKKDGTNADGILQKPGNEALELIESLVRRKYHCGVDTTRYPGARWYQFEPKGGSIGPVSRIHLTEYAPNLIENKPKECYIRVGGT